MISAEQNELMTRVGRGTPCGKLLRRYWQPVALSDEMQGPRPIKAVRILGENLVLFRDGGRYGLIQARPLTFDLGEFPNALAARARVDSLAARNVPAYVAPVPYSDGSERWKVYAGAYRDSTAAQSMRRVLEVARLPSTLVERTGRPPASPK